MAVDFHKNFNPSHFDDTTLKHFTQVFKWVKLRTKSILTFWETCSTWKAHGRACRSKDHRMLVVTKKESQKDTKEGRHSSWWLDKQKITWGNKEWKSYRGTKKYTVDRFQDLKFDLEGNTNPVEAFQEKLNITEAKGTEVFLSKSTTVLLFAIFNFQAYDWEVPFKALTALQDGNSSSTEVQARLLRRNTFTCQQIKTVSNWPVEN